MGTLNAEQVNPLVDSRASPPGSADDSTQGFRIGDRIFVTTGKRMYTCVDAAVAAAVWKDTTVSASSGHPVTEDTVDPTVTDDTNAGFSVGDHWLNTVTLRLFQATNVSVGVAVWERVDQPKINIATSDPLTTDDNTKGYEIHSVWVNTASAPPRSWVATDVATSNAVWIRQTNVKNNIAAVAPVSTDDADSDYEPGSQWFDSVSHELFICITATVGSANWFVSGQIGTHILPGTVLFGTVLDYPSVGSGAGDSIQYVAARLLEGKIYDRLAVFIDSGGTIGRTIQAGVYDQTALFPAINPNNRVALTDVLTTDVTQPDFFELPITDGAGTPQTYTVPTSGLYWLALTVSSNAVKFATTPQFRANFLPKRTEAGSGGVPASAGTLTNPAAALMLVALIEVGVVLP